LPARLEVAIIPATEVDGIKSSIKINSQVEFTLRDTSALPRV